MVEQNTFQQKMWKTFLKSTGKHP